MPNPARPFPVTQISMLLKSRYAIVTPDAPGAEHVSRSISDDDMRDGLLEIAHDGYGGVAPMA